VINELRTPERVCFLLGVAACFAPVASASGTSDWLTPASGLRSERVVELAYRLPVSSFDANAPVSASAANLTTREATRSGASATTVPHATTELDAELRRAMTAVETSPLDERSQSEAAPNPDVPLHPALTDKFFFGIGAYLVSSTTEARLDSPSGIGTSVGFEELLGLDNTSVVPQGLARWRMSDRWRLELEYFQVNRSNSRALTQDVTWGDETFLTGTTVTADFDVSVARLSAGYSFFKTPDKEIGVALGFHVTTFKAELSSSGGNEDAGKVLAPLPVLSMYGQVALTEIWALSGRLDAFKLSYDPYQGHIYSLGVDAICQPWRHVGFGLGFRTLEMEASAEGSDWTGAIRTNYTGPIVFLSVTF
jgi:hypothetical protein